MASTTDEIKAPDWEGWLVTTFRGAKPRWRVTKITAGIPNSSAPKILAARPGEVVIITTQTANAKRSQGLSDNQQGWVDDLGSARGVEAYHWSPDDQAEAFERANRKPADG